MKLPLQTLTVNRTMGSSYELLLECYRSGQIPEPDWQQRLREDEVFRKWLERNS